MKKMLLDFMKNKCVCMTFHFNTILRRILGLLNPAKAGVDYLQSLLQHLQLQLTGFPILEEVWNDDTQY
ncbi:hypothetical protein RchiOBHm_Chr4g0417751 [Rosa chinensis]|uniref:Uncharacterized protein n=1 Tax=Rosa chinensis TaxID=74649 RepID=A0A2P6QX93_ROSCH|nr:hypothetical protein RchiOBHm_Chr4g0417751 [Rosa chinensis]